MDDVDLIYHNKFGIAFRWNNSELKADPNRIQIIFKDMGFYLLREEILQFSSNIKLAEKRSCSNCQNPENCRNILLRSPLQKMDFTVSSEELEQISELIEGTLFRLNLLHYLDDICKN
ncbi:hypothetical protein [Autumnicola psychrophila]|uniref:Uncharacterized protein n=1 Tax=Autumnicola psychrophila TaxID=3075592 RepID=A0ABU3DVX4_9FLAO|nr:hypothetical protein [Zunongwangia sp. F225]MDT0687874.1 hypothetical protein [Zunongwangia sp. F225]